MLNRTEYPALELLLVDNGTTDPDAASLLDELAGLDRVRVLRRPGAFNWSALNNAAAAEARGTILVLLNNDVTVLRPDWLTVLAALAVQPGVGAVGAKLLYPDGRVQHAGLTTDQAGIPRHLFRFAAATAEPDAAADASGSLALLGLARDVWGLTGACLAIPRDAFEAVGGLNEALPVAYNDVDLCLRLTAQSYRLVWTPWSVVEHRELTSRPPDHLGPRRVQAQEERNRLLRDWGALALHDPFFNPNLRLVDERPCLGRVTARSARGHPAAAPLVPLAREDEVSATQARRDRSRLTAAIAALQACRGVSARRAIGHVLAPVRGRGPTRSGRGRLRRWSGFVARGAADPGRRRARRGAGDRRPLAAARSGCRVGRDREPGAGPGAAGVRNDPGGSQAA